MKPNIKPNEGRLQTAEHILLRILKDKFDAVAGISKFGEDEGLLEVKTQIDLRDIDKGLLEADVNKIIGQNLDVKKYVLGREDAAQVTDLTKLPPPVKEVTIIDIEGFDKSPCRDPHVTNTADIGKFEITDIERVGQDRYRFSFKVV